MIAQFTLVPIGTKTDSLSKLIAKAVPPIVESGLDYKLGPMGTVVEGDWYQIINLINRCRKTLLRECDRLQINITFDDRKKASKGLIGSKVKSLEKKTGLKLKK